ncbi:MAG: hypothetical protein LBJ14_02750 [Desulfarculales bacterium]|jgi:hypothetical protein|nr:hypothetical protein [Desulfarculales bacterium]
MARDLEKNMEIINRLDKAGTEEEYEQIAEELPISATVARAAVVGYGKEFVLSTGLNFSEVEKELGPKWMDDVLREYGYNVTFSPSALLRKSINNSD